MQREGHRAECDGSERERQCQEQSDSEQYGAWPNEKEVGAIHKHRAEIDPCGFPRREPSLPPMMADTTLPVLVEPDRYLRRAEIHVNRFQDHFRGVLPGLGLECHPPKRVEGDPPHAAMDVREVA